MLDLFFTFIESLEMIFSQYKETCEATLDYPKMGGEVIKYYVKKAVTNILHANIDVHSRRLISKLPGNGVNLFQNFSHIVQTWILSTKVDTIGFFSKLHINEGIKK